MTKPKISIVGAGPGDPELITVKAVKALSSASVVFYDALVNKELLRYAPKSARKIFVGKRSGMKRYTQDEINKMLVDYASSHGHVVRLKGGDPFVFGRGYEEMKAAKDNHIEVDIVPGISSAFSLPALQGVPLTNRSMSQSFWVLTATTKEGLLNDDIALAIQSTATVVILMGLHKIDQIVNHYKNQGKEQLPIMVIEKGSTKFEKVVVSTIADVESRIIGEKISTPAILVIGAVVNLYEGVNSKEILDQIHQKIDAHVAA